MQVGQCSKKLLTIQKLGRKKTDNKKEMTLKVMLKVKIEN